MPFDPVTAVFNFLCTPAGQKIADLADATLQQIIMDLIRLVHKKNT